MDRVVQNRYKHLCRLGRGGGCSVDDLLHRSLSVFVLLDCDVFISAVRVTVSFIYLDNAATTPILPDVREAMMPYLGEQFANPSSLHEPARDIREEIEDVRQQIAQQLDCQSRELVFTSGGTEADNMAVKGIARAQKDKGAGQHVITSEIEHKAVLTACKQLEREGFTVTRLPVDERGLVSVSRLREALQDNTVLVSIMLINNEVGTRQPIRDIAECTQEHGVPLHTDAVQAAGKVTSLSVRSLGVDAMTLSGHKVHGPKGVGLLYLRQGVPFQPVQTGGNHENGRRAGTENVPGIIGLGTALETVLNNSEERVRTLESMTDQLRDGLRNELSACQFNTPEEQSAPGILNVSFPDVEGETMVIMLDREGICASTGAACESDSVEISHVLRAMSHSRDRSRSAVRFSMSPANEADEMERTVSTIKRVHKQCVSLKSM